MADPVRSDRDAASGIDAIELLISDHREVGELFDRYRELAEAGTGDDERRSLAEEICTLLTVHATIEEEIFYPAARGALDDGALLDEAEVEHQTATGLIAQIQDAEPSDALYDAQVHVLGEYVDHHVQEEEGELFPQLRQAGLDLAALGAEMSARQEELLSAETDLDDDE